MATVVWLLEDTALESSYRYGSHAHLEHSREARENKGLVHEE